VDQYLPGFYRSFREQYGAVASGLDRLAATIDQTGGLDERSRRLVKLGIAIGNRSEGAVRSNARKALALGLEPDQIRQAALLAITSIGFAPSMAALQWIEEVLSDE
jgi:alkylhydroperoxidase/carboxymuconolactone decarboxylase family protein YurZ